MTTKPNDGGAAFPEPFDGHGGGETGMSLRDYFAAHAPTMPQQWLSHWCRDHVPPEQYDLHVGQAVEALISWRWYYADAMLAAREETQS